MKRNIAMVLLLTTIVMLFCSCFCEEHQWLDATCTEAKECSVCGWTEGEALGHNWSDATCEKASTCSVCEKTKGVAVGHKWSSATCTDAKRCNTCGKTSGSALGHKWKAATCTEAKKCKTCGEISGTELGHSWLPATATTPKKCERCYKTEGTALGEQSGSQSGGNNSETVEEMVWIPTHGGTKYHRSSTCSSMINPQRVTKEAAIQQGFTACGRCY